MAQVPSSSNSCVVHAKKRSKSLTVLQSPASMASWKSAPACAMTSFAVSAFSAFAKRTTPATNGIFRGCSTALQAYQYVFCHNQTISFSYQHSFRSCLLPVAQCHPPASPCVHTYSFKMMLTKASLTYSSSQFPAANFAIVIADSLISRGSCPPTSSASSRRLRLILVPGGTSGRRRWLR